MKTLLPQFLARGSWRSRVRAGLLPALLLGAVSTVQAQTTFPRFAPFTGTSSNNFRLGGTPNSATLTGTGATGADPLDRGFLRLTNATNDQSGFAIDNLSFPAPQGFSISFEFFSYGGTGADGFSVFLIDANKTSSTAFTPGASGGSLGYAQKTIDPISNGVPNGYIGIGIDEFGNYSNPTEGRVGGRTTGAGILPDGRTPNAISIRGAGNGQSDTDYPYITGSGVLPFSLDVGTSGRVTNPSDANYRRAYIDVIPQGTVPNITYRITVRIQHGNSVTKAIDNVTVPTPPANLRIGFAGSTGGDTNVHEIRNLAVVQSPIANDDVASTIYNRSVTLNILSNDVFYGSNFQPGTVDLDITTPEADGTKTVPEGTFAVTSAGVVTFTPIGTFAGVVTLPYRMQDAAGKSNTPEYTSNPANIVIIVEGADLNTTVNGPTAANPGSRVAYTVSTANLGTQTANNVVPTMRLPAGLSGVTVSSGSYDSGSGLVTFGSTVSLPAGAAPIINTVSFIAPGSGSVTGEAGIQTPPGVPDPVSVNNTATITTIITGIGNVAGICATPGKDGPAVLDATSTPNTYYPGTASVATGARSISIGAAVGTTPIAAGDLLLVMQMQGAEINTSNSSAYGSNTGTGSGNLGTDYTAGTYEFVTAAGPVSAGAVPLTTGLVNSYSNDAATATAGPSRFQVIRVPQYSSLTISGAVTGTAWNGSTGGVLVLDVAGQTTFAGGSLTMTGKGFRGGGGKKYTGGNSAYLSSDFVKEAVTGLTAAHASKGEGIAGAPLFLNNNGTAVLTNSAEEYPGGSLGRGAPGNAGGGGTDPDPGGNSANTGGGGGANGGAGGAGGAFNLAPLVINTGGKGGSVAGSSSAGRLILGGGGGAGTNNNGNTTDNANTSSGGDGGGIIIFRTGAVSGAGSIQTNGDAGNASVDNGSGGGGAGGSVLVAVQLTGSNNLTVQANGGAGGNSTSTSLNQYGDGGGGGGGQVYANGSLNAASVAAGGNGRIVSGATDGEDGAVNNNATVADALAGVGACLPALDLELAASPNSVARAADNSVSPVLYTLTISNTGGAASTVSTLTSLPANIFTYDPSFTPVATLRLSDGTESTATITMPTTGNSTPSFGATSVPAGATLSITFRATIASTAVNNFAYQANATVTYTDPTRVADGQITGPSLFYATGEPAPGSNYSASTSTAEDVTITGRPLPVELKSFEAKAVRNDGVLNWATAQEVNNDRFEVERSFDGQEFEPVGTVRGQGTTARATDYKFTDAGIGRQGRLVVYYRLRQVDTDGKSTTSTVRSVKFESYTKANIALYPNPAHSSATLDLTGLPAETYKVQVLDMTGRLVGNYSFGGTAKHTLDLLQLPQGTYVVRVIGQTVNLALPLTRN